MGGEDDLLRRVVGFCRQNDLLAVGDNVLVACSGGPDSLALLDMLCRLQAELEITVAAAHFEHGIRGAASLADAAFVADFCRARRIPCYVGSGDVPGQAKIAGRSVEETARAMRYEFLRHQAAFWREREPGKSVVIAVAHHRDDQAETVLMRLIAGTGLSGLGAMRPRRGDIIRPLLPLTKEELTDYCRRQGLEPRHDATNDEADATRNRLRLELLPQLKNFNPQIAAHLCQLAEIAQAADEDIRNRAEEILKIIVSRAEPRELSLDRAGFGGQSTAIQREIIRALVGTLSFERGEKLRRFILAGQSGKIFSLPDRRIVAAYDKIIIIEPRSTEKTSRPVEITIGGDGVFSWGGKTRLTVKTFDRRPPAKPPYSIVFDGDKVKWPLTVRVRRPGDRLAIAPGRSQKVKDFLINAKVPAGERANIPILTDATGEIIWLAGRRQAAVAYVDDATRKFIFISYNTTG